MLAFPFPVVHVENAEHMQLAVSTAYDAYELGISFSGGDSGTRGH